MKWHKFPILFKYNRTDADGKQSKNEKELECLYCSEPYIKIVPHPEVANQCIMVDALGVHEVALSAQNLWERFNA